MAAADCIDPCTSSLNPFENIALNYKMIKPLDEALRCRICFDYYNNCMTTKCSHNYCSVCIRRYMTYKSQCPTCFQDASEPELRNNRLVDEILRLYKKLRIFDEESSANLIKAPEAAIHTIHVAETSSNSKANSKRSSRNCSSAESSTPRVKIEIPDEEETVKENAHTSIKREPGLDEVTCPVCYKTVSTYQINSHLDICLKQQFDEVDRKRTLPKLVYHLLSDKEIRVRLREHGLNATGDRQTLIRRHKSYITLYNANCDSLNPKPLIELVKEIELQELEEKVNALPKQIQVNKKSDLSQIQLHHDAYIKKHQSQFNSLINDVHQRQISHRHIKIEKEDSFIENCTCNHIKQEKEPAIENCGDETTNDDILRSSTINEEHSAQQKGISFVQNDVDETDSSSSDSMDTAKTVMNLHRKRKKATISIKNQESPKKK